MCVCVCVFCSLFLRVINTFNLLFHGFYSVFFIHGGDNDKDGSNTFKNASSCGCCCWKGNQLIKSTHTDALMSKYILQNAAIQVNRLGIVNSNSPNDDRWRMISVDNRPPECNKCFSDCHQLLFNRTNSQRIPNSTNAQFSNDLHRSISIASICIWHFECSLQMWPFS